MEAFSDGVFAIAITLLVLDFAIHPPGSPLHQVLHIWPSFVAYIVSFLTIGAAWLGHTALTDRLDRTDSIFLRIDLLLLLVVTFLPFPTGLVGEALRERTLETRLHQVPEQTTVSTETGHLRFVAWESLCLRRGCGSGMLPGR